MKEAVKEWGAGWRSSVERVAPSYLMLLTASKLFAEDDV